MTDQGINIQFGNRTTLFLILQSLNFTNFLSTRLRFYLLLTPHLIWSLRISQLINFMQQPFTRSLMKTTLTGKRFWSKSHIQVKNYHPQARIILSYTYGRYSRVWVWWRTSLVTRFSLFGLQSNRGKYTENGDDLSTMPSLKILDDPKPKLDMFLNDISITRKFSLKIHTFLRWLNGSTAPQFTFRMSTHIGDIKQQNFTPPLSDLLFLDIKKPWRNFSPCQYLELLTSLSQFSTSFQKTQITSSQNRTFSFQKRKRAFKKLWFTAPTTVGISTITAMYTTKKLLRYERLSPLTRYIKLSNLFQVRKFYLRHIHYCTAVLQSSFSSSFRLIKTLRLTHQMSSTRVKSGLPFMLHRWNLKIVPKLFYVTRPQPTFISNQATKLKDSFLQYNQTLTHAKDLSVVFTPLPTKVKCMTESSTDKRCNGVPSCVLFPDSISLHPVRLPILTISVLPKYSRRFKRSLFFFLLLLRETKLSKIDWLTSVYKYSPFYTFTLFPSANNFKMSIFKRLNFQKHLLTTQLNTYSHMSYSLLKVPAHSIQKFYDLTFSLFPYSSIKMNFALTEGRFTTSYPDNYSNAMSRYIHVRRIKLKPGYSRLWRESRSDIQEILEMKIRYQNRLTLRLHQLYRQQGINLLTRSTVTVFFSLLGSQISTDMWSTLELLKSELIYVNGQVCTNLFLHLFLHDLIQVVINLKFYFLTRFLQNRAFITSSRINKIFYRKYRLRKPTLTPRVQKTLPWTFLHLQGAYIDILPYLEVDYFTLSSFVILDQHIVKTWLPIRAYVLDLNIINMYNWKYIT